VVALVVIGAALAIPAGARRTVAQKKQAARTQFENAERMREALNGRPAAQRNRREYSRVIEAYRSVYYTAPTSNRADAAVVALGELLAEMGRQFNDERALHSAIGQYEFLRREYPGSRYRVQALFTIAQIYKDDLGDAAQARASFQEFLKRYPHSELADDARAAIKEIDQPANHPSTPKAGALGTPAEARKSTEKPASDAPKEKPAPETAKQEATPAPPASAEQKKRTLVTGIRHWSTPDYTRVAIDLQDEVQYDTDRIDSPDRVYFDLHNTYLSSTLKGKSFDVEDGFLHRIRVAQFQRGETRVVLELDEVSEYSAFLLPNPYRLIIDVHGKRPQKMAKADAPKAALEKPAKAAPEDKPAKSEPTAAKAALPAEIGKKEPLGDKKRDAAAKVDPVQEKPTREPTFAELSERVAKLNPPDPAAKSATGDTAVAPAVKPKEASAASSKRGKSASKKALEPLPGHEARPTAKGERSLIRALGLKIGRIVVDAGHGGHDTGTIGPNGLLEKDLVLDIALRLGKLLETRMGAEVVYTRDDDTFIPLETRTAIANQNQADLFISVHANSSSDPAARGVETYYLNFTTNADALEVAARENAVSEKSIHELQDLVKKIALKEKIEESREFAVDVQQALYSGLASRGLRNRGVRKAPFIVLIGANMPSILAEISFVSNPADAKRLKTPEYRRKIAEALYRGTAKYVSGLSGLKVASKVMKPAVTSAHSLPGSSSNE
jgi:N-acetylmuramoyl-L-alanine amidase